VIQGIEILENLSYNLNIMSPETLIPSKYHSDWGTPWNRRTLQVMKAAIGLNQEQS
jgi:hypothetical protein